jgi:hypothetical protein
MFGVSKFIICGGGSKYCPKSSRDLGDIGKLRIL